MTTFKLFYTGYIRPQKQLKVLETGFKQYDRWSDKPIGVKFPPVTGEALKVLLDVHFSQYSKDIVDGDNWVFVLRHDQVETTLKHLRQMGETFGFSATQVHKSPNFSNLNYCAGNYLNLYIFKVKKNG